MKYKGVWITRLLAVGFWLWAWALPVQAQRTQQIPLFPYTEGPFFIPSANPHTPDPTDPNQFRATLTGNTLNVYSEQHPHASVYVTDLYTGTVIINRMINNGLEAFICQWGEYSIIIADRSTCLIGYFGIYEQAGDPDVYYVYSSAPVKETCIIDWNGRVLIRTTAQQIDLSDLPQGIYFIRTETTEDVQTTKILRL